jgi:hypothetical protein
MVFNAILKQYFSYIVMVSFIGGGNLFYGGYYANMYLISVFQYQTCHGRDNMGVAFTTTYAVSANPH